MNEYGWYYRTSKRLFISGVLCLFAMGLFGFVGMVYGVFIQAILFTILPLTIAAVGLFMFSILIGLDGWFIKRSER